MINKKIPIITQLLKPAKPSSNPGKPIQKSPGSLIVKNAQKKKD